MVIRQGKKKVKIRMIPKKILPKKFKPLNAKGINMVTKIEDNEEEEFLQRNPNLASLFEIDIKKIAKR